MSGRFDDQVVLITGGARGMGASHARGFAAEGATVLITDVLDDEGEALAESLGDRGRYVRLDVTSPEAWVAAVEVATGLGDLAVLVNNAGIGGAPGPLVETTLEAWRSVLAVNLDGAFLGIKHVAPVLAARGGGAIVNVSSFAGLIGSPLLGAYQASKFALRGLTKTAAAELGPLGVRVNSVHPGYVRTALLPDLPPEVLRGRLALERFAESEDITPVVLFAASADARYVTGTELVADGGWANVDPTPLFVPPGVALTPEIVAQLTSGG